MVVGMVESWAVLKVEMSVVKWAAGLVDWLADVMAGSLAGE